MNKTNIMADKSDLREINRIEQPLIALQTLIFHVTGLCNLKCQHCWQSADMTDRQRKEDKGPGVVSPADFACLLKEAKALGLIGVKFTGGEPFLHPDIMNFLEVADQEKLSVGIETNGTLIDEDAIERLKSINHLFIAVSLDGGSAYLHDRFRGVKGAFDGAIAAIERLTRVEIPVQIILSLHRKNVNSLDVVVKLADDYGVQSIKINPIQPMGRGRKLVQQGEALPIAELLQAAKFCKEKLNPDFKGELFFSLPLAFQAFTEIRDQQFSVCRIFQILGLMPDGDLSFCGIGNIARAMVTGNIYKDDLADIWEKAPLLLELRERLPQELKGVCKRCILKALCLGECRAMAYEQTGDLMGPYWICQQAYDEGLFPESRLVPDIL